MSFVLACNVSVVFSSRRRHTRCALVTGVQTCALPICDVAAVRDLHAAAFRALAAGHHSLAQIAAHEALILAPEYAEDLARSHVLLALHDTCGLEIGRAHV